VDLVQVVFSDLPDRDKICKGLATAFTRMRKPRTERAPGLVTPLRDVVKRESKSRTKAFLRGTEQKIRDLNLEGNSTALRGSEDIHRVP